MSGSKTSELLTYYNGRFLILQLRKLKNKCLFKPWVSITSWTRYLQNKGLCV